MIAIILSLLFTLFPATGFAQSAQYFSNGQQTNSQADTVLATTGVLNSGGLLGANYEVTIMLNGSGAMTYKLETLSDSNVVVNTIYLSAPANQAMVIDPHASFFIPNGYSLRIRNNTGVILGGTLQASIILKTEELVDK